MAIKGDPIRFIAGKYAGRTGWINIAEDSFPSDEKVAVIVNHRRKGEYSTKVLRASIRAVTNETLTSYADAVMNQCPDIEKNLVMVTRQLAKCDINKDVSGFQRVINEKMNEAIAWQDKKGSKAMYRKINFQGASSKRKHRDAASYKKDDEEVIYA